MSSRASQFILVSVLVSGALGGCGQKGPLFLPTGEAAANRATLPETLRPGAAVAPNNPASTPTGAASPVHTP